MARVAVIGLGKLGTPLATVFASKGHKVVGLDLDEDIVASINARQPTVVETDLAEYLQKYSVHATTSYEALVKTSDTAFIIVPTPSKADGSFSNEYVLDAVTRLGAALKGRKRYYNVVICSTVMPGSCNGELRSALEFASERTVGIGLGLNYSPEFIALGSVINDLLHPDMVLIGQSDDRAGQKLGTLMRTINDAPIRRMSLTSAEIAKISVNAYVTMKISFANTLGELCENTPDANGLTIADAIGLDSRIGRKYLTPATAFGGPCFPRDSRAFASFAEGCSGSTDLAVATQNVNERQFHRIITLVEDYSTDDRVGILGLSYKPNTTITEESFGSILVKRLEGDGYEVLQHDPYSPSSKGLNYMVDSVSVLVICTPWPEYKTLAPGCFERNPQLVIIDCWDMLQRGPWEDLHVYRIGVG